MNVWFYIAIGFFLFQLIQNLILLIAYKEWRKSNERLDQAYKENINLLKHNNISLSVTIVKLRNQLNSIDEQEYLLEKQRLKNEQVKQENLNLLNSKQQ
jgi:hypothetical protein